MRHCVALFIIGVLSGNCWNSPQNLKRSPEISNCTLSFDYRHCLSSQEGIHDLDCYRQQSEEMTRCEWKPGQQSSNKTTYTVIIEQKDRNSCKKSEDIFKTSHLFDPFKIDNMTVYVVDASSGERNCTIATFTGIPQNLVRCGPPTGSTFHRDSRQLVIQVTWADRYIKNFLVEYRELNSLPWKMVDSCEKKKCVVNNLTSSMYYEVKVKCVQNLKCPQCPWSNVTIVPPELTSTPFIEKFDVIPQKMGKRLIITHWKFTNNESVTGYSVEVGKESGEFNQTLKVYEPILRLILSGSAYYINISAFNRAGASPRAHRTVPAITGTQDWDLNGNLNVTLRRNSKFEVSWNQSLTGTYDCYSVEWGLKGAKMSFNSFHRKSSNHNVISLKAPLQPYKKYVFLLHMRPDKNTCDLKHVNNSESTSGRTEVYAEEGTPTSAPEITGYKVSSTSIALEWRAVPEDNARGFLLGYIIYYTENGKEHNSSVVMYGAGTNNYKLSNLKSQTPYKVQLSAFTAAGEGVRSASFNFKTANPEYQAVVGAVAGIGGVVILLLLVAIRYSALCKRAKELFWPSIPNPGNSNAIQKIYGAMELEVLEPRSREKLAQVEESDTSSLLIIEGAAEPLPAPASPLSILDHEELLLASSPAEEERPPPSQQEEPSSNATVTAEKRAAPLPAVSDYTTMELFQQTMAQPLARPEPAGPSQQAEQTPHTSSIQDRHKQDYIRQATCLPNPETVMGSPTSCVSLVSEPHPVLHSFFSYK